MSAEGGHTLTGSQPRAAPRAPDGGAAILEERPAGIRQRIARLCDAAKGEHFEDGMESRFSEGLVGVIDEYGDGAVESLAGLLLPGEIGDDVASEALRWLGLMERGPSYAKRRWLLERCLSCDSAKVRDGAALGLSFLDDPHAMPHLEEAAAREPREWLRERIEQVIDQLREH